jgi:hypothetical protein
MVALVLSSSIVSGATVRGYVIDMHGHRAAGAHIEAWHDVPTDQRPPQHPTLLAKATADAHGAFATTVDSRANILIATFDHQVGSTAIPFSGTVRIVLRPVRSRHVI